MWSILHKSQRTSPLMYHAEQSVERSRAGKGGWGGGNQRELSIRAHLIEAALNSPFTMARQNLLPIIIILLQVVSEFILSKWACRSISEIYDARIVAGKCAWNCHFFFFLFLFYWLVKHQRGNKRKTNKCSFPLGQRLESCMYNIQKEIINQYT